MEFHLDYFFFVLKLYMKLLFLILPVEQAISVKCSWCLSAWALLTFCPFCFHLVPSAPFPYCCCCSVWVLCLLADSHSSGDFPVAALPWSLQFLSIPLLSTTIRACKPPLVVAARLHSACGIWHRIIVRKLGFFRFHRQLWCIFCCLPLASTSRLACLWIQSPIMPSTAH